jgi:thiol-disulfide isomerase/thioredoxin
MTSTLISVAVLGLQLMPMPKAPITRMALQDVAGVARTIPVSGKATVLFFVATDCPIANRYAPEMSRIVRDFQPRGISFAFVYVDPSQTSKEVREHLKEYRLGAPGILDMKHTVVKATGATVTPEAVMLAKNGTMLYRGRIDDLFLEHGRAKVTAKNQDLRNAIKQYLAGKPIKVAQTPALGCSIPSLD